MLKFYYYPGSCSLATNIALEEAGVEYEAVLVDLLGDRSDYLQVNSTGKVPAILNGSTLLTENVALLQWIAETNPEKNLMPGSGLEKAEAVGFLAWCSNTAHIARRQARIPVRFSSDTSIHAPLAEAGREAFWAALRKINSILEGKTWVLGDNFSVCDCYALVFYDWGIRDEQPMEELEAYNCFKDRMLERVAAQNSLQLHNSPLCL